MRKRRQNNASHESEDQYGETGRSQDNDEAFQFGRGGLRGGGSAGVRSSSRDNVIYERHVPKFLQKHIHHLRPESVPQIKESIAEDDNDAALEEQEALALAVEQDPSLAKEVNPEVLKKAMASKEKELGNAAYAKGDHAVAIRHFSKCIELDPRNEIYYSNRSAVYSSMKEFGKAVVDAESVIRMKPSWVKGWARLAVAYFGLEQYSHAVDAYNQALKIEPHDNTLLAGRDKAETQERKQIQENKHKFTKRRRKEKQKVSPDDRSKPQKIQLSYEDEEER